MFEGRQRHGGVENGGFFAYSLGFSNGGTQYTIYADERAGEYKYKIGLNMNSRGKRAHIKGLVQSQQGSLSILDDTTDKLPNAINQ